MSYENQNQENSKVRNALSLVKAGAQEYLKRKIMVGVAPLDQLLDDTISDITTTIGSFVVRNIKGRLERSITFDTRHQVFSQWMEEALYGILYRYNDIKNSNRLALVNHDGTEDGSAMYYELDEGIHNLKYRKWNILLHIEYNAGGSSVMIRDRGYPRAKTYTLICFDLDPEFPRMFERDMIAYRNSLLKIKSDSPTITVYRDYYDGYVYWDKSSPINKRRMNTIYLPREKKELIVNTVNKFFSNKEYYRRHGIPHNLKILLYGPPGPQPVDTMIPTPIGMRRFGDLKVGDYVFSHMGHPTKVTEIYDEGEQEIYEVILNDGRSTKCTAGHLWQIARYRAGEVSVEPTGYIADFLMGKNGEEIHIIDNDYPCQFDELLTPSLKAPAAIFAYYAICGTRAESGTIMFKNIPEHRILALIKAFGYSKITTKLSYVSTDTDTLYELYDVEVYRADGSIIDPYKIFAPYDDFVNAPDDERVLPDELMYAESNDRYDMIKVIDTMLKKDDIELYSDNGLHQVMYYMVISHKKKLIDQFMWLARSTGVPAIKPKEVILQDGSTAYVSAIDRMPGNKIPFDFPSNLSRFGRNHYTAIKEIKKLGYKDHVMCIKVDDPEHLYMTNDFIVTHNTGKDSIAKMIASEWNRNLYYVTGGKNGQSIPSAITSDSQAIMYPMFLISDIDKYPFLINEPEINIENNEAKEEQLKYKQLFASMINALDGVMAADGRIIVMTTNHIEKFSDTFLRPGRVDLKLEIGYVTPDVFRRYVYDYYGKVIPKDIELRSDKLTIAELQRDVVFMELSADEFINKYVK